MRGYLSIPGQAYAAGMMAGRRGRAPKDGGGGEATMFSSIVNILNTILGAGILAMPFVVSQMGILLGAIVIVWSCIASGFGLYLQSRCARYLDRGTSSFFAVAQLTYPNAAVIFDLAIAIKCFGVGVSYLIIIGDLMPGVVAGLNPAWAAGCFAERSFWITVFMIPVMVLSFMKKLDSLRYTSLVALVSIAYLVILVLYSFAEEPLADRSNLHIVVPAGSMEVLKVFPVVVFAYTCHQNMFSVLNEIKNNSPSRIFGVIGTSVCSACALYILIAITGYFTFGNDVTDNLISQYPNGRAALVGKASIVVLEMFSVPLQVHPCRNSVDGITKWLFPSRRTAATGRNRSASPGGRPLLAGAANSPLLDHGPVAMSEWRFTLITSAILIASYALALWVTSLKTMLAWVGATGSTSISFILPGVFYYKISDPESTHHQRLLKDDDDADDGTASDTEAAEEGSPALAASVASIASVGSSGSSSKWKWGRSLRGLDPERIEPRVLRRMAYALAVYGIIVSAVCMFVNIFTSARGH